MEDEIIVLHHDEKGKLTKQETEVREDNVYYGEERRKKPRDNEYCMYPLTGNI